MTRDDSIAATPLPPEEELPEDVRATFDKCREKFGFVPNVLRAYTGNVEKFRNFAAFYNTAMLGPSGLSKLEREMIAVVVSAANRCFYCLVAHGQALRSLSGDPILGEQLAFDYKVADLSPRHRAMLDHARKLTLDPSDVEESDREALRAAGLSEAEIFDLTDVAAFFNYTNRMAHGIAMRPNAEYHALDR